jgi:hypothetical protein
MAARGNIHHDGTEQRMPSQEKTVYISNVSSHESTNKYAGTGTYNCLFSLISTTATNKGRARVVLHWCKLSTKQQHQQQKKNAMHDNPPQKRSVGDASKIVETETTRTT